jgi:hypothetical protein
MSDASNRRDERRIELMAATVSVVEIARMERLTYRRQSVAPAEARRLQIAG